EPLPTLTAGGGHIGLCQPYLVQVNHGNGREKNGDQRRTKSLDHPFPTVAGNRSEWSLCQPFIIGIDHQSGEHVASPDTPLSTVTSKQRHAIVQPYLVKYYGSGVASSVD